ncbi:hypothetical protein [Embleya sp. NPDC020630]
MGNPNDEYSAAIAWARGLNRLKVTHWWVPSEMVLPAYIEQTIPNR